MYNLNYFWTHTFPQYQIPYCLAILQQDQMFFSNNTTGNLVPNTNITDLLCLNNCSNNGICYNGYSFRYYILKHSF